MYDSHVQVNNHKDHLFQNTNFGYSHDIKVKKNVDTFGSVLRKSNE